MKDIRFVNQLKYGAAPAILGLAMLSSGAYAQEAPLEDASEEIEEDIIVVTGSRINNPNLELASPVTTVSAEEINLRQANVVEEFIREIPGVVPGVGAQVNNGNGGSTFLNLRGIGANRNLVLLNGTRVIPAGLGGITNVDVIPIALIGRTDVLTGGAGAAYGADAIGGVVNFITKTDFSGVELSVTQGITDRGDGETFRADLTIGGNFDDGRGNATLSVGYTNRTPVTQGQRGFSINNISSTTGLAGGSSTAAPTRISLPGQGFQQISEDGSSLVPFDRPFNFNPFNLFQVPLEQFRIFGTATYEITDGISFYSEGLFTQSTNRTEIAPSGSFGVNSPLPLNNPFLNDTIRNQICDAQGITQAACDAAGATPFGPTLANGAANPDFLAPVTNLARRFVEFGPRINERQTRLFQIKLGVRGDLTDTIEFDVFAAYGESDLRSAQSGNGTRSRLDQSLFSIDPDACLDTSGGCVPINILGPVGSITPEVQQFLDVGNTASTATSLGQVQAFLRGDVGFALPSASQPISFVAGGEYREYTAFTASDLLTQTPGEVLGNGAASPNQGGGFDVAELFGELVIPIISDVKGFQELNLELGGRISDYSTTGTEYTWKAGGSWTVIDGLTIRGNFQRVTRAPNIGELFAPPVTGLDNSSQDPCQGANPVNDAALAAICLAQGAPASAIGNIVPDPAGQINVTTSGNPDLAAEDADTYTIGVIFRPSAVPGLSITADYYNISITDTISSPTVGDLFAACFGAGASAAGAPNLPAGALTSESCTNIGRNPFTGNLFGDVAITLGLPQVLSNQGAIATDGIDVSVNYQRELGFANWNLSVNGNWTNSSTFQANVNDPNSINRECVGFFSADCASIQPEFSASTRNTLQFDSFDVSLLWRYIDSVELEPGAGTFLPEFSSIDSEHYFDLTVRAQATENLELTLAVLNLFDNDPPFVGNTIGATGFNSGNTFPSTYDPLGRRFSVTARLRF